MLCPKTDLDPNRWNPNRGGQPYAMDCYPEGKHLCLHDPPPPPPPKRKPRPSCSLCHERNFTSADPSCREQAAWVLDQAGVSHAMQSIPGAGKPMSLQQLQQLMAHARPWIAAEAAMMISHHALQQSQQQDLTRSPQTAVFAGIQVNLAFTPSHVAVCCGCKAIFMDMLQTDSYKDRVKVAAADAVADLASMDSCNQIAFGADSALVQRLSWLQMSRSPHVQAASTHAFGELVQDWNNQVALAADPGCHNTLPGLFPLVQLLGFRSAHWAGTKDTLDRVHERSAIAIANLASHPQCGNDLAAVPEVVQRLAVLQCSDVAAAADAATAALETLATVSQRAIQKLRQPGCSKRRVWDVQDDAQPPLTKPVHHPVTMSHPRAG